MTDCNVLHGFKISSFLIYTSFSGQRYYFNFWMMDMKNIRIFFSDVLTVVHSHSVGVINLSLVIINPQVSLETGCSVVYPGGITLPITTLGFKAMTEIMTLIKLTLQYLHA